MPVDVAIDFGRTAADYATHRQGFPEPLWDRLEAMGIGFADRDLVDLGTGTGAVARALAGRGARVTALDPAPSLLAEAARLAALEGLDIEFREATAEATGLPGEAFDIVTAGQCWHWFDRRRASAEVFRLLRKGGRLAICHFDWIPEPGSVVEATEELILRFNPDWKFAGGMGVHPRWLRDMTRAGLTNVESFSFDWPARYSHAAWRGRIRASAGIAASLADDRVAAFDAAHARMLAERFPDDPLLCPHRVFAVVGEKPA